MIYVLLLFSMIYPYLYRLKIKPMLKLPDFPQLPGALAGSDARLPGMRTVTPSILRSGNILSSRFGHEIISTAYHWFK